MGRFGVEGPYGLGLSLDASSRFSGPTANGRRPLWTAVRVEGVPVRMKVRQVSSDPPVLEVAGVPWEYGPALRPVAEWMLFAGLSLQAFYRNVADRPVVGSVTRQLTGLKPNRPPTVFEMAVTAVTEQQISMAAAYQIRSRLVRAYGGAPARGPDTGNASASHAFPTPGHLAAASLEGLQGCGLSRRKAECIRGLARGVVDGRVDPEGWTELSDEEARATITEMRGFGPWSADYILVRGLGRLNCVPASDLGVRTAWVLASETGPGWRPSRCERHWRLSNPTGG